MAIHKIKNGCFWGFIPDEVSAGPARRLRWFCLCLWCLSECRGCYARPRSQAPLLSLGTGKRRARRARSPHVTNLLYPCPLPEENPKVGHKLPKIVPFLSTCWYGVDDPARDRRGNNLPAVVAKYREISRAVDGANQMALQIRQKGRQVTCSHAVRAFMLRYAAGECLCNMQGVGVGGQEDHHVGVPVGHPQAAVLCAA